MEDKGKAIYGLDKIPIEELLKASRREVGELTSYIDELIYDKKMLNKKINQLQSENQQLRSLSKQEREKIRQQEFIKKKDEEISELKSQLVKLRMRYDILLSQSLLNKKE